MPGGTSRRYYGYLGEAATGSLVTGFCGLFDRFCGLQTGFVVFGPVFWSLLTGFVAFSGRFCGLSTGFVPNKAFRWRRTIL